MLIIGGSILLKKNDKIFNTSLIYDKGKLLASHDKVHTFDIDIPGQVTFKESEYIEPGKKITVVKTRFGNFGVGICYDIRFCDYAMAMRKLGAHILFYPSVFTMKTGPMHFEKSGIARALDTQSYVVLASNARYVENLEYTQSYAHSSIINSNGEVVSGLKEKEGYLIEEIDLDKVLEMRKNLPYTEYQVRNDLYELILK